MGHHFKPVKPEPGPRKPRRPKIGALTAMLKIRISPEQLRELNAVAEMRNKTLSEHVRERLLI